MTNLEALRSLCNSIANTFYPDEQTVSLTLFNEGIDAHGEAAPKDKELLKCAIRLVRGYVEGSRNENGTSTSVRDDAIKSSILFWCKDYGLDADEALISGLRIIDDGTHLW